MIEVSHITKTYRVEEMITLANDDISFRVEQGEMIWVQGRSGSGKTTLMNMITGLDSPDKGTISFFEKAFSPMNDTEKTELRRDAMGLMFQHFELLPMLNGYENIKVPLFLGKKLLGKQGDDLKADLYNLADDLVSQIRTDKDFLRKKVTQISGGQKQVINIIRALIYNPRLLIGDEITSHLDVEYSHNVYVLIQTLIKKNNSIGIFISHDTIIEQYVDRIFVMEDGTLKEQV